MESFIRIFFNKVAKFFSKFWLFIAFACCFQTASANDLDTIRQNGVLRVGVLESYLPFSKVEDGNFRGFEIELAKALANEIFQNSNGKIQFVPTKFPQRTTFLQENKVDATIALFPVTEEAKHVVDFSMPYLTVATGILSKKSDNIKSINDFRGKKIALQKNTVAESLLEKKGFDSKDFVYVNWFKDCYKAVKDGTAGVCAGDNIAVLAYPIMDSSMEVPLRQLGELTFIGVGVSKGNDSLRSAIDAALIKLSKNGFFKKAYNETFEPFYKGAAEKKYFLLDDLYSMFG
ncbi:transporter substrate-binding domain-containing protein [Campylobacter geochelonis]|uniref:Amino acid n=1 Tax=Campylobacter geochelonis TaxID=1780362 RepID=A0A128EML8_9BACT|nr:transporter substrate-binding domain-containing protein [Campylobacter geochelonis]QKF72010.1 periplasmic cysteine-binding protein [Campylobacter geochelonis]CZE45718.1 amino acid [Campylobacter geochelonis]CZE46914.1 amino acid [Campylobacter geochelonis]CZE49904.1 amino acid [Campylobacter geochelonis]